MWSDAFIAEISKSSVGRFRMVVESIAVPGFSNLGGYPLLIASHAMGQYSKAIAADGHSFTGASLKLREWASSPGEARIKLTGDHDFRLHARRGQLCQVRLGFAGWALADYQQIFTGHLQDISRNGEDWFLSLRGVMASLICRQTEIDGTSALFNTWTSSFDPETALSAPYTPADATVSCDDTTHGRETGGNYLIEITPDTGEPFILTATGQSGGDFTGVTSSPLFGGSSAAASTGALVRKLWYIGDHPVNAVRKIIISGDGSNGAYDTLLNSWGIGTPEFLLDHADIDQFIATNMTPTGYASTDWAIYGATPVENGLGFIVSILSSAGAFLTERQGLLTIRAVNDSDGFRAETIEIHDSDIVNFESYNTWEPGYQAEYNQVQFTAPSLGSLAQEDITSRPTLTRANIAIDYLSSNVSNWLTNIVGRCRSWFTRVPESVRITVGLKFATAAPGTFVVIYSKYLVGRSRDVGEAYLITQVDTDWFGGTVTLTASHLPERSDDP